METTLWFFSPSILQLQNRDLSLLEYQSKYFFQVCFWSPFIQPNYFAVAWTFVTLHANIDSWWITMIRKYFYFISCLPNIWAALPILSVQTLLWGGIFLAPHRRKFNRISKDLGQTSRNISDCPLSTIWARREEGCCDNVRLVVSNIFPPALTLTN